MPLNPKVERWPLMFWLAAIICLVPSSPALAGDCLRARTLYEQGNQEPDYAAKLPLYQEATRLCPDLAQAWNNLADAEEHLGRLDPAVGYYRKALSLDPNLAISHFSLGDIYLQRREFKKACLEYVAGLKLDPKDELALKNLGEAEAGLQAEGRILNSEYIIERLGIINLMGPGGARPRIAFQNILFDFDSDRLKPEGLEQMDQIGRALEKIAGTSPDGFLLEGHTDNKGSPDYNQKLSERRAARVKGYLVDKFSLDPEGLTIKGRGLSRPVASNDTQAGRARNRRVEFSLK